MSEDLNVKDKYTVTFTDEQTQEIFMSFGLLNKLAGYVSGLEEIHYMLSDPNLREGVILECLAVRDQEGDVSELSEKLYDRLSGEEALGLIDWVVKQLTNFFTLALKKSETLVRLTGKALSSESTQGGSTV